MNIRYFTLRYVVQLLLIVAAFFSACALFGFFYALALFIGRLSILLPIGLMLTSLWLFWKTIKQPPPTMLRIFFVSYALCGVIVSFIPDPNGNNLAIYFWCGAIPFLSVAYWTGTDAIVSRLLERMTKHSKSNSSAPKKADFRF